MENKARFGWKRKKPTGMGDHVAKLFQSQDDVQSDDFNQAEIDWLHLAKKSTSNYLENCQAKSNRLRSEGNILAASERYWEAINKWNEALELTPNSCYLYELKAQALMQVGEVFPAVQAAEKATQLNRTWSEGFQTLGRSQIGLGEVDMAIRSFQIAIHLDPSNPEIWNEDLAWARSLQSHIKLFNQKSKGIRYHVKS